MGRTEPMPDVTPQPTATPGGASNVSFSTDVGPIFSQRCVQCHGGQAGLYLETYDLLWATAIDRGVIVSGDPEGSILLRRIRGEIQPSMPLGGPALSSEQIAAIETWIRDGASNN